MPVWTSTFQPRIALELPEGWSAREYDDDCVSCSPEGDAWMSVDLNVHPAPGSEATGVLATLSRAGGLHVLGLAETVVGGRAAWRFEADVLEDMTYDDAFGESADEGDRTVVHVVGVDDRVVAIHATAPEWASGELAAVADRLVASIRFGD